MIACSYVSVDTDGNERGSRTRRFFRETFSSRHRRRNDHVRFTERKKSRERKRKAGEIRSGRRGGDGEGRDRDRVGRGLSIAISCPGSNGRAGIMAGRTAAKAANNAKVRLN